MFCALCTSSILGLAGHAERLPGDTSEQVDEDEHDETQVDVITTSRRVVSFRIAFLSINAFCVGQIIRLVIFRFTRLDNWLINEF